MAMAVGGKKGAMADPNVVPLIDILLVLIIIFMVITPTIPKGLEALVPQPNPHPEQAQPDLLAKTVVVQVFANGALKINEEIHTWDDLGPRIEEIFKQRAEKIAFVKSEDEVRFRDVAKAIDIMRSNGVDKVGLITAKIEAGQ
jgi:biopolymer transport protein ExbD